MNANSHSREGLSVVLEGRYARIMIDVKDLLQRALSLPPEARAALAGSLLESLDPTVDADAEAAWSEEIHRRLREIDAGAVKLVPWSEAQKRISG